ncbi:hypothetical protein DOLIC_00076 [Dolichomitus sp. PSUC_FEM 10030005]|nr:hypothetical protein [Dolichomitus sp. PSUC_FEM 10030005]
MPATFFSMYPRTLDTYKFKLFVRKFFAKIYLTYSSDELNYSAIEFCQIIDDIIRDQCKIEYSNIVNFLLRVYHNTTMVVVNEDPDLE